MNVLESRAGRPLRLRPWVLLAGAAVVVAVVLLSTGGSSPQAPGLGRADRPRAGPRRAAAAPAPRQRSTSRRPTRRRAPQNVAPNTTISLTFSAPVSLQQATPSLSPDISGKWVQTNADHAVLRTRLPAHPLHPGGGHHPGRRHGCARRDGATSGHLAHVTFDVAAGDTLRLQQLLASSTTSRSPSPPAGRRPSRVDLAEDQPGTFSWRWPGLPSELTSQWTQGTANEITKAAVEAFETQNNLGVDGIAGPAVWTSLLNDAINDKPDATPYVYVLVNKVVPQNLTLWNNGVAQYVGIPVNTGAPGRGHDGRHLRGVRARALLGHEGDQPRRLHLQRPQRALCQLLQRRRCAARLHPRLLRVAPEQRLRGDELRRRRARVAPDPDRHARDRRGPELRHGAAPDDDHDDRPARDDHDDRSGADDHHDGDAPATTTPAAAAPAAG